nr:integrase, catalytic region, zinc finger, CCHC-type, peptidase aspartic, catalytic [Tanacetum cinerariifolium]
MQGKQLLLEMGDFRTELAMQILVKQSLLSAPTAQTMFMANLSSANPIYDEAGPLYDSDILSEVQDHDNYLDSVDEYQEVHEMHNNVQQNYVVDSDVEYTSDSNIISYDRYVKNNAEQVVQSYKNPLYLTSAMQVQSALSNGHEIVKTNHTPTIVHDLKDTLEIAEITRKKMLEKMKSLLWIKGKIKISPPDYSKENHLAIFIPQNQLSTEQIFWSSVSKLVLGITVYPPNTPARLVPGVLPIKIQSDLGMIIFGEIMGYGDYVIGDGVISTVYYVEGLRHNLLSVGQFCDLDLEVAFKKHLCYVRDVNDVVLPKGSRGSNLYTIFVEDMMKSSPICLLSKASKKKSCLWHCWLNHLNFGTINDLIRKDLVRGLPRLKFKKDHICSACQLGKSKKDTHKPKSENTIMEVLHTLHMDLCGPMRVQSINEKKYILVIVDDWVKFFRSKDETSELNGIVERRNCTLMEAARTMLIFSKALMFLWAEEDDSEQQLSHESNDDMEYHPSNARGDDEVKLNDEESSNSKDEDEVAKIFRIETNMYILKILMDLSLTKIIRTIGFTNRTKMYHSWRDDGYCNGGNLPGAYIVGNALCYQDFKWYKALKKDKLKEEALKNKAIMEGIIQDEDNESSNEGWRRWNDYENTNHGHKEREYEMEHENKERCELGCCLVGLLLLVKVRRSIPYIILHPDPWLNSYEDVIEYACLFCRYGHQMMKGSDIGIQEKKAKLFNEWERFTSNERELIESYYHRFLKLMNDLERNKHLPKKIANNLKFLNNLQPEWSRHNYLQQPMPNLEDITDPTTAMNMELALMAKAFKLNYSTPTNNNQRISSNPRNRQIAQSGMNMGQDRQMQMVGGYSECCSESESLEYWESECINWCSREWKSKLDWEWGVGHYARNCTVRPKRRDATYLQTQLQIAQKEEAIIHLQAEEYDLMAAAIDLDEIEEVNANCILMDNLKQASTSGTQTDSAPVYDSDGSAEKKQQSLYDGKVLVEKHDPPVVHDSEETLRLAQESREKMKQMNKGIKPENYTKINHLSGVFVP